MCKRFFDIVSSLLGILVLSPLFVTIGILIRMTSRGPFLFKQNRVGRDEITFKILKFRTMIVDAESLGPLITVGDRDPRVTRVGYFLRKYKLDELPQLFNVFLGDMSIVGPRPEVLKYVKLYNDDQKKVLSVRPGITDIASIIYFNESELLKTLDDPEQEYIEKIMPEKLKINLEYIDKMSFWFDMKLILKTLKVL